MKESHPQRCMSLTVPVLERFASTARVTAVSSGKHLCLGQVDGRLVIDGKEHSMARIRALGELANGSVLVAADDGLHCFRENESIWFKELESGAESLEVGSDHAILIDGLGRAFVVDSVGNMTELGVSSTLYTAIGKEIAIATESGQVTTFSLDGLRTWSRPQRGDIGERITSIGWNDNRLVVAREGHGLVPGEEEALEVEVWLAGTLERRFDVKRRVISIDGPWMGLDMGGVMHDGQVVQELQHPVHTLINCGDYVLAASWFHLYKVTLQGTEWSVETVGMAEHVSSNRKRDAVLIGGSDQNDFTDSEPVVLIDSTAEGVSLIEEESALDDWGEAPAIEISADELYGDDTSLEDLAGIEAGQLSDTGNLLDALNDEIQMEAVEEEEEDLMLALSLDAEQIIAPAPDAGGDQSVKADDDGTAVIMLDGSGTRDPQDRIVSWSWVDDTGREIANSSKVRVKLKRGSHRLELRIKDVDGRWASDSCDVRVE